MKRKKKLRKKDRYSQALFLFGQCYSPSQVAHQLDISENEARQIHAFYLYSQQIDESTKTEMTEYYKKHLQHKEIVERTLRNVNTARQKELDFEMMHSRSNLFLEYLARFNYEVIEIFFYSNSGKCLGRWTKKIWDYSPFWIKFGLRFYSAENSSYCYN